MIHNLTKRCVISRNPVFAVGFWERARGMVGRNFRDFDAMVFQNCGCIHTMFMSINIDVFFINRENRICGIRKSLKPWIPFVREENAVIVIELPDGAAEKTGAETGDIIDLNAELTESAGRLVGEELVSPKTITPFKATEK